MPVYNEATALERVVREWLDRVGAACPEAVLCLVDDGSTDATPAVLDKLAAELPALRVLRQANAGHGQACMNGYRAALAAGARWVLQVDSDGQCDASYFDLLWRTRGEAVAILGRRRRRGDGLVRTAISRLLSVVIYGATGVRVRDANSPYRLMRGDALADALARVRPDVHLANILIALTLQAGPGITWVDVGFRPRIAPTPFRARYFLGQAIQLWGDLWRWKTDTRRAHSPATGGA
jgi:glycosyltransferase involved in cell wall biosynthesis